VFLRFGYVVCGAHEFGALVANSLVSYGHAVVVIWVLPRGRGLYGH
jgi:hypothetical protein